MPNYFVNLYYMSTQPRLYLLVFPCGKLSKLFLSPLQLMLQDYRVFEMLTLAQDMGVFELRAACEDHVISTLSVDNACTFLTAVMDIHEKAGKLHFTYTFRTHRSNDLVIDLFLIFD